MSRKLSKNLFIFAMLIYPIVQFLVFYVGINANSVLLSLQEYNMASGQYTILPFKDLFKNFQDVIYDFRTMEVLLSAAKNSAILLFFSTVGVFPIHMFVAYSIYKKFKGSAFFTIVLMLPSMIPGIVFLMIFRYFVEFGFPIILNDPTMPSLISNPDTAFMMMIVFQLWLGFAGGLIVYLGAMSRIPPSLIEYGQMEGMNAIREIWHVVLPMIFPTITVMIVTWFVGFFVSQGPLYGFFQDEAPANIQTIGYYYFIQVIGYNASPLNFPYASAAGLIFTFIAAPLTILFRWVLERFGPNPEY